MKRIVFLAISLVTVSTAIPMQRTISELGIASLRVGLNSQPKRTIFSLITPLVMIKHQQKSIIERWGKFDRILEPGLRVKIPFVEDLRRTDAGCSYIDMRERVLEMPKQFVITKDNVSMGITAFIYYEIRDPKQAVYGVENLPGALDKLGQTSLRNLVGTLHLDETLVSRDAINNRLRKELGEAADKWGVSVTRVELQEVNPPKDIIVAMEREMTAERNRRALILDAEGEKRSAVLRAEAVKETAILEAEGKARARLLMAAAEAQAMQNIQEIMNLGMDSSRYLMAKQHIEALPKMAEGGAGKTIIVPYDAASLMSATSMIKSLFDPNK